MKQWCYCLSFLVILMACNNNGKNASTADSAENESGQENDAVALKEEPVVTDKKLFYIWQVNADAKTKTKNPALQNSFYNVDTLITGLNENYPRIKLEKTRLGHDTLYTMIGDAQYLTEQMGSAGAEQYVAQVVLNLTSVQGINYVRIDFAEGSHASPDVWSKESFNDYKELQ